MMDIESRLRALESRYRQALSASVAAKAHYLALLEEPSSSPASIRRARIQWENLDARKRGLSARMGEIEDLEQHLEI
jgi:hypothetical protein